MNKWSSQAERYRKEVPSGFAAILVTQGFKELRKNRIAQFVVFYVKLLCSSDFQSLFVLSQIQSIIVQLHHN